MEADVEAWAERVEQAFHAIEAERMRAMALVNPALQVEAVGFRRMRGGVLGVLITPWSMILLRIPDAGTLRVGATAARDLPRGAVDFVGAYEDRIGAYESCSLFSPMFDFPDQATARAVADEVLAQLWATTDEIPAARPQARAGGGPLAALRRNADHDLDRRGFLRGAFLRDDPDSR
ncbi:Hydrogenase maturation factor HoxT/HybE [Thioalkalivibrio nitratireducens DSM 14787]|uniref:Hydrogenase maturation factor HoxT/HybE n=1 Tax=Thioalkalivibrio nitratireducens (strain DSM 14787 / UNIQEM 213 / ALEN2) TaxID=1255043 RepID=L0DXL8_THIND|nr:Hydrogenase maturation factor HoxT/HybE [Thioalkalivibrio nitratireducens DSM 14787]